MVFTRIIIQYLDRKSVILSTFLRSQHCVQPLVQSVVTGHMGRVGHDGDRLLTRGSFAV